MSVERQLTEVKAQLDKIVSRLDDLVVLEAKHDNTVEAVNRCHKRVDKLEIKVEELAKEAAANTFLTRIGERIGWLIMSAAVGLVAYFIR